MTGQNTTNPSDIRERVREGYSDIAETGVWLGQNTDESKSPCCSPVIKPRKGLTLKVSSSCCGGDSNASSGGGGGGGGGCCGPTTLSPDQLAQQIGYSKDELAGIPEGANLGLSCGNPGALASLKPGDVVLDLGSGAGFDCFLAGPRVGATGRVIGVDMTPKMLDKARANLAHYRAQTNLDNIEFRLGEIENIPAADSSVDVVISNCVINLSPDKPRVWREIARVLRSGGRGRVAISDLALKRPLPEGVGAMIDAWIGCIAGASLISDLEKDAKAAGLVDVTIDEKPSYVETLVSSDDPLYRKIIAMLPEGSTASDYIASVNITARRP
jgi:SAM-dependent methyltransferase